MCHSTEVFCSPGRHLSCVIGYHVLYVCAGEDINRNRHCEDRERCIAEVSVTVTVTPTVFYPRILVLSVQTPSTGYYNTEYMQQCNKCGFVICWGLDWFCYWFSNSNLRTSWQKYDLNLINNALWFYPREDDNVKHGKKKQKENVWQLSDILTCTLNNQEISE